MAVHAPLDSEAGIVCGVDCSESVIQISSSPDLVDCMDCRGLAGFQPTDLRWKDVYARIAPQVVESNTEENAPHILEIFMEVPGPNGVSYSMLMRDTAPSDDMVRETLDRMVKVCDVALNGQIEVPTDIVEEAL